MKNALISPNEPRGEGYRVAEVSSTTFVTAPPLFWVECADNIVADKFWYNPADGTFVAFPEPVPPVVG